MRYNFFLYAIHFALVRLLNKTAAVLWGEDWLILTALFFLMPAVMVWFGSRAGKWLKEHTPILWSFMNGGRQ